MTLESIPQSMTELSDEDIDIIEDALNLYNCFFHKRMDRYGSQFRDDKLAEKASHVSGKLSRRRIFVSETCKECNHLMNIHTPRYLNIGRKFPDGVCACCNPTM